MKILGSSDVLLKLDKHEQEPGVFFGSNDVLKGPEETIRKMTSSFWGESDVTSTYQHKLYLHIPRNTWSVFTGKLREYYLPWRWQAVYLKPEEGYSLVEENNKKLQRILVCNSIFLKNELSESLDRVVDESLFILNLMEEKRYQEIFGKEFLIRPTEKKQITRIAHPLGEWMGLQFTNETLSYQHIYRVRSLYSFCMYKFLKRFSASWKEKEIRAGDIKEKVLVKEIEKKAPWLNTPFHSLKD